MLKEDASSDNQINLQYLLLHYNHATVMFPSQYQTASINKKKLKSTQKKSIAKDDNLETLHRACWEEDGN